MLKSDNIDWEERGDKYSGALKTVKYSNPLSPETQRADMKLILAITTYKFITQAAKCCANLPVY